MAIVKGMEITKENISELAPSVMSMLEQWKLKPEYVLRMLGVEELAERGDLVRFRGKKKAVSFF